jgi:FAD/FMN-containing dehydrogenase
MDGNVRAKALALRWGVAMRSVQQSYVVPTAELFGFLNHAAAAFREAGVYPNLLDALYLPPDGFLMSSSRDLAGFCVSFVFQGVAPAKLRRVTACLTSLNKECLERGGRLHMVKNVFATPEELRRMYKGAFDELASLKARVDPQSVLVNDFYRRTVGTPSSSQEERRHFEAMEVQP